MFAQSFGGGSGGAFSKNGLSGGDFLHSSFFRRKESRPPESRLSRHAASSATPGPAPKSSMPQKEETKEENPQKEREGGDVRDRISAGHLDGV